MKRRALFANWQVLVALVLLPCTLLPARAGFLTVTPSVSAAPLDIGQTFTIFGKVSNVTGVALRTTDVFLSFSGFPFLALDVNQLLGNPDLALPDRSTSPLLALFDVTVLPGAVPGLSYDLEFFGQDINGVFSAPETIAFSINAPQGLPEPGSLLLGLSACAAAMGAGRRRSTGDATRCSPQPQA